MDMSAEEAGVLLLISSPGGSLAAGDHDIVVCQPANTHPGTAVAANAAGQWRFVYITDRTCMEVMHLMEPLNMEPESAADIGNRWCCVLDAYRATICSTYRSYQDAPLEQTMTWAEFEADFCVDKSS